MAAEAYPLHWPAGWERANKQIESKFDSSASKAHGLLLGEVGRMGGRSLVLSTNVPLKANGTMHLDREPVDPGVAVYFELNNKTMAFACDKYDLVRDNMLAIAKTIEAMRGIQRWGASDMLERAFRGFAALPEETPKPWREVLGISGTPNADQITAMFKSLAKTHHPDAGGDRRKFEMIVQARDEGLEEIGQK